MNTKSMTRGGVQTSKKLLAALAVMAVAFVVLAAVPSVATDSDAAEANSGPFTISDGTATYDSEKKSLCAQC